MLKEHKTLEEPLEKGEMVPGLSHQNERMGEGTYPTERYCVCHSTVLLVTQVLHWPHGAPPGENGSGSVHIVFWCVAGHSTDLAYHHEDGAWRAMTQRLGDVPEEERARLFAAYDPEQAAYWRRKDT